MSRLKISIALMILYLAFVFNLARLDIGQINGVSLHPFVYVLITLAMISVISLRFLHTARIWLPIGIWLVVYLIGRFLLFNQRALLGGADTYLAISEVTLLTVGTALAYDLARQLFAFETYIENITFAEMGRTIPTMQEASEDIKAEFIRSRRHERPLSLLVIEPSGGAKETDTQRFVQRVQESMLQRFVAASLAQVINKEARRTDLVATRNSDGRFMVLCPETSAEGAARLAERVQHEAINRLGIRLVYGYAAFPDEALTFEDLLAKSERNLEHYLPMGLPADGTSAGQIPGGQSPDSNQDQAKG